MTEEIRTCCKRPKIRCLKLPTADGWKMFNLCDIHGDFKYIQKYLNKHTEWVFPVFLEWQKLSKNRTNEE